MIKETCYKKLPEPIEHQILYKKKGTGMHELKSFHNFGARDVWKKWSSDVFVVRCYARSAYN